MGSESKQTFTDSIPIVPEAFKVNQLNPMSETLTRVQAFLYQNRSNKVFPFIKFACEKIKLEELNTSLIDIVDIDRSKLNSRDNNCIHIKEHTLNTILSTKESDLTSAIKNELRLRNIGQAAEYIIKALALIHPSDDGYPKIKDVNRYYQ